MNLKKSIYFVLGGPGSGKGAFCANIIAHNPALFSHLSAGELLRQFNRKDNPHNLSAIAKQRYDIIEHCMHEGLIVPAEITIGLILDEIDRSAHSKFLIDGFPRNKDNYNGWNKLSQEYKNIKLSKVVYLECSESTMLNRIHRRAAESSQKRVDDNIEAFRKRMNTFLNETVPIVNIYDQQGMLLHIDAEKSQAEMYEEFKKTKIIPELA